MEKRVCVGESGKRIGESHHRASLTDDEVDLVRELNEAMPREHDYRGLAWMFSTTINTIKKICRYERRACTPKSE